MKIIIKDSLGNETTPVKTSIYKDTKEPIIGATVFVVAPDSTLAGGAVSDGQGKFTVSLARGEYTLKINYLGLEF